MHAAGHFDYAHLVPQRSQRLRPACRFRAPLQFGGAVAAAEIGQVDRLLYVQVPVERGDQGLDYVVDNGAAAGRAQQQHQGAVAVEHHGRRHAAARPLARLDAVGHLLPVLLGDEGKIGELVIQEEAAHHLLTAEGELDRAGHGHGVARGIDDGQMAGGRQFGRSAVREFGQRRARRCAGQGMAQRMIRPHQGGAPGQILGRQQPCHRHRHEVGVGEVALAVGVGEPLGVGDEMRAADRIRRQALRREPLQHAQHLQHGDTTGAWRRHAADFPLPVRCAQRFALQRAVVRQIARTQVARVGRVAYLAGDVARDLALVESVRALRRDGSQRVGERRVLEQRAYGLGRVAVPVVHAPHRLVAPRQAHPGEQTVQPRRQRKALGCEPDGGREQFRPGQLAVPGMRELQRAQHARRAD